MCFIFSTPVLMRHLWQLKTIVFLHCCLICALLLINMLFMDKTLAEFSTLEVAASIPCTYIAMKQNCLT